MSRLFAKRISGSAFGAMTIAILASDISQARVIHSTDCHESTRRMAAAVAYNRREFVNKCENPAESAQLPACPADHADRQPFCSPRCTLGDHDFGRGWDRTLGDADENHRCSLPIRQDVLAAMGLKDGTAANPRASTGAPSNEASQKFKDLQKALVTDFEKDYPQNHDSNAGMQGRLLHTIWEINRVLAAPPLPATNPDVPDALRTIAARATLRAVADRIDSFLGKMHELKDWANHAPSANSYLYKAREEAIQNEFWMMMTGCPGSNPDCQHPARTPVQGSISGTQKSLKTLFDAVGDRPNAPAAAGPRQGDAVSNLADHLQWFNHAPEMERFESQWEEIRLVRHCRGMLFDIGANSDVTCQPCANPTGGGTASPNSNTPEIGANPGACVGPPTADGTPPHCVGENVVPPNPPISVLTTGGALTPPIVRATLDWSAVLYTCGSKPGGVCVFTDAPANADPLNTFGIAPGCRLGSFCPGVGDTGTFVLPATGTGTFVLPLDGAPGGTNFFNTGPGTTQPILVLPTSQ